MPTVTLYPATALPSTSTWVNINNVLGNTTAEATSTGVVAINGGIYIRLGFDTSAIPAGSIINSVICSVVARSNAINSRAFLNVEQVDTFGTTYTPDPQANMTTAALQYNITMNNPDALSPYMGSSNLLVDFGFISRIASSRVLYLQKGFLTIDYSLASTGKNVLFMGENF